MMVKKKWIKMYTSKKIDNSNAIKLKFLNIMLAPPPKKSILEARLIFYMVI